MIKGLLGCIRVSNLSRPPPAARVEPILGCSKVLVSWISHGPSGACSGLLWGMQAGGFMKSTDHPTNSFSPTVPHSGDPKSPK